MQTQPTGIVRTVISCARDSELHEISCVRSAADPKPPKKRKVGNKAGQIVGWVGSDIRRVC